MKFKGPTNQTLVNNTQRKTGLIAYVEDVEKNIVSFIDYDSLVTSHRNDMF